MILIDSNVSNSMILIHSVVIFLKKIILCTFLQTGIQIFSKENRS